LEALDELTEREASILKLRFGLGGKQIHTLKELGEIFGITRERIRQIQKGALRKLRHPMIARNENNPDRVMTFTIYDDALKVNLSGWVDQMSDILDQEDRKAAVKDLLTDQSGSALFKVVERLSGPVHVSDVNPSFEDGEFTLTFWKRIAGLRFAPLKITMGQVDNPEAADDFIETLVSLQKDTDPPGIFSGPLDYWITWMSLLIGIIVLVKWPRKNKS